MNALLDHVWGQSPGADRAWAQVTGLAPSQAAARLLAVFQAFIDDSYTPNGTFVLAGHVAPAESWAWFSVEWERLLPKFGTLAANGRHHFKMAEMNMLPERMARVPAFFRVIEDHVTLSLSCKINAGDLARAKARICIPKRRINWGFADNLFLLTFRYLLDVLHVHRHVIDEVIDRDQKIDFIFDNQAEKRFILQAWDEFAASRNETYRNNLGATPRFEDDHDFLPLQAADFWAWWVRKWHEDGTPDRLGACDFGTFKAKRSDYPRLSMTLDEDDLADMLCGFLRTELPGEAVLDMAYPKSKWTRVAPVEPPRPMWPLGPGFRGIA